jgi:hypothetical protein
VLHVLAVGQRCRCTEGETFAEFVRDNDTHGPIADSCAYPITGEIRAGRVRDQRRQEKGLA